MWWPSSTISDDWPQADKRRGGPDAETGVRRQNLAAPTRMIDHSHASRNAHRNGGFARAVGAQSPVTDSTGVVLCFRGAFSNPCHGFNWCGALDSGVAAGRKKKGA